MGRAPDFETSPDLPDLVPAVAALAGWNRGIVLVTAGKSSCSSAGSLAILSRRPGFAAPFHLISHASIPFTDRLNMVSE